MMKFPLSAYCQFGKMTEVQWWMLTVQSKMQFGNLFNRQMVSNYNTLFWISVANTRSFIVNIVVCLDIIICFNTLLSFAKYPSALSLNCVGFLPVAPVWCNDVFKNVPVAWNYTFLAGSLISARQILREHRFRREARWNRLDTLVVRLCFQIHTVLGRLICASRLLVCLSTGWFRAYLSSIGF